MERFDIELDDRLTAMVDAVERGEVVEIVRDGTVVAQVNVPLRRARAERRTPPFEPAEWEALHRRLAPELLAGDAAADLRMMRDAD